MFYIPTIHKCDRCGHEMTYSQSLGHPAPLVSGDPVCPKCFEAFMRMTCGVLRHERRMTEEEYKAWDARRYA